MFLNICSIILSTLWSRKTLKRSLDIFLGHPVEAHVVIPKTGTTGENLEMVQPSSYSLGHVLGLVWNMQQKIK